jgi:phenylacetic acid degradation operon negative regulatory protein
VDEQLRRRSVGAPAARSVLLTILGEYVLGRPDGVWQETLVGALGALGYSAAAARQALSRSTRGGWLVTERHSRRARMRLSEETAELLRTGAARIYSFGEPWTWDGRWLLVVVRVPEQRREVRHHLRTRLAWAGLGSLGGGLWLTPHAEREVELGEAAAEGGLVGPLAAHNGVADVLSFTARLGELGEPEEVIRAAWDLSTIGRAYSTFLDDFGPLRPRSPEASFRALTTMVHAWRKFPFLDPDLPPELLPRRWPRQRAHALFHDRHADWSEGARGYFEGIGG